MKVETPQILWNSEGDKGRNAPLYSVDMIESGISDDASDVYTHVMVTAGNTNVINMWKVNFFSGKHYSSDDSTNGGSSMYQKQHKLPLNNQVDYITSLTRHELSVNAVAFSPDGLHLATAGEAGNIVIWSVPVNKRGNGNGRHFWSTVQQESDLLVRIVSTHAEGVYDISWSSDSKRFMVGTIDSLVLVYEDKYYETNLCSPEHEKKESDWQLVFRNGEHTSLVQGVAFDPLSGYLASMGSDRTVRIFPRKLQGKSRKKVLRPANSPRTSAPPPDHQQAVTRLLTESKLEIGKTRRITQKCITAEDGSQIKQRLFVDESNCESFFRRLAWTADGAYLITPAALWHPNQSAPSFATYMFARHRFDEPCRVLPLLDKPSVVVRPNPVLFEIPEDHASNGKENSHPSNGMLHRSVFAVLTLESVLVYDTYHLDPLCVISGLHYAGLTDCCWSRDGMNLVVSSSDGYISIVNFAKGELGTVFKQPSVEVVAPVQQVERPAPSTPAPLQPREVKITLLPPCEPGQSAVLEGPPAKRMKKTRITPTLISSPSEQPQEKNICKETERVGDAVTKLSLGDGEKQSPKKKKRVQPMLISN